MRKKSLANARAVAKTGALYRCHELQYLRFHIYILERFAA